MTLLVGEYVPSKAKWVRDQVEEYEASGGARANTLRGGKDPIVVITSVGRKSGAAAQEPADAGRARRPVPRRRLDRRRARPTRSGTTTSSPTRSSSCRTARSRSLYRARLLDGRRARGVVGVRRADLADVRRVPGADRAGDPDLPPRRGLTETGPASWTDTEISRQHRAGLGSPHEPLAPGRAPRRTRVRSAAWRQPSAAPAVTSRRWRSSRSGTTARPSTMSS